MSCKIIAAGDAWPVQSFDWGQPQTMSPPGFPKQGSRQRQPSSPEIAADLQQQLDQARQQGIQEGLRQAEAAAGQRVQACINEMGERLAQSIAAIAALRPRLRHEAETQVVELALQVARKILHRTMAVDPDALAGLVSSALSRIDARELLEIRVGAAHHAAVRSALDRAGLPCQVQVVADASLELGAVLIETGRGRLDASVSTQLSEIERGFADYLSSGGAQ